MYKKTVLVFLGHGPDQKRQIQGQEDDAVATAQPEARAREEDEEREQRDHEDEYGAHDVVGRERVVRADGRRVDEPRQAQSDIDIEAVGPVSK